MIQVIHRALNVLELLATQPDRLVSLGEIADALGLNPATCSNILKTLAGRGYVERLDGRRGYRLGTGALQLGGLADHDRRLVAAAEPVLRDLTARVNETSLVGVIRGNKRVTLASAACDRDLQVRSRLVRDVYATASGRLLLAYDAPERLDCFLQQVGLPDPRLWKEARSEADLRRELAAIRRKQLAVTRSPEHVVGLAVPVRCGGQVVASASIYLPEARYSPSRRGELIAALRGAGDAIAERLEERRPEA